MESWDFKIKNVFKSVGFEKFEGEMLFATNEDLFAIDYIDNLKKFKINNQKFSLTSSLEKCDVYLNKKIIRNIFLINGKYLFHSIKWVLAGVARDLNLDYAFDSTTNPFTKFNFKFDDILCIKRNFKLNFIENTFKVTRLGHKSLITYEILRKESPLHIDRNTIYFK